LANFKITISDTKGKSITRELKDNDANPLLGLLIGQETDASLVGLEGKIKITGGSDKSGVPMRSDLLSSARKRILIPKGVGMQQTRKGLRRRKLLRGNTISEEIYQINSRYDGEIKVEEPKKEEKVEASKEKPKVEASKEKPKVEASKEKPKVEASKEKPKVEASKEKPKVEAPKEKKE
jgi:small subunit ribosomal protein S6e